jgi:hypothetical protein
MIEVIVAVAIGLSLFELIDRVKDNVKLSRTTKTR